MEINYINVESYPASEKIYVPGTLFPIKVGMRKISLTPTVTFDHDNNRIVTENAPVCVYDTSGPFTDPDVKVDINRGIPRLREQWIADLKTRVSEIQDYRRIKAIDAALPLIEKWLSDDDMFALDMEKIEALLGK